MAIVGVVVRWTASDEERSEVLTRLGADPRVTVGPSTGEGVAITVEAPTAEVSGWLDELGRWPGVTLVTPVFHDFEDELGSASPADPRASAR